MTVIACIDYRPRSMSSGFSCCMAKITMRMMFWKVSWGKLNIPCVQCLIMFMTRVKKPSR